MSHLPRNMLHNGEACHALSKGGPHGAHWLLSLPPGTTSCETWVTGTLGAEEQTCTSTAHRELGTQVKPKESRESGGTSEVLGAHHEPRKGTGAQAGAHRQTGCGV